jgi:type IV pilus assembly protein PilA
VFCTKCGESNPADAKFCFACGTAMHAGAAPSAVAAIAPVPASVSEAEISGAAILAGEPPARKVTAKRCPSCGLPNRESAERCACGNVFGQPAQRTPASPLPAGSAGSGTIKRPGGVTALAVLQFIGGGLWALTALICLGVLAFGDTTDGTGPTLFVAGVLTGGISTLQIICGLGLWRLKSYGRTIQLVMSWIGLIGFPIGTLISIVVLIYLTKPGIKILFSGKSADEFTPDEMQQVLAATQGGIGTVIAVMLIALAAIAVVGIMAAIAVPGLLRARIAGNEASAIGSIRAVSSAQSTFAASCANGLYARTLNVLGTGPSGASAFISPDLGAAASVTKSGYTVTMRGTSTFGTACNGATNLASDYQVLAVPVSTSTGTRRFCSDQTGIIREQAASSESNGTAIACPTTWSPVR